jgi:glycosyltransferase involved in cell wall biosynthesis
MKNKKIIVLVSSDLVTDQRVLKECATFHSQGFIVEVHCRRLKHSLPLPKTLPYIIKPMRLVTETGVLMFLHLNITLLFRLLFAQGEIIWSNDLDTLLPAFITCRIRHKRLVYDSHELYTETPSLIDRPFKRSIWKAVESLCVKRLHYMITVNESIKDIYQKTYQIPVSVVRNVPPLKVTEPIIAKDLKLEGRNILILQGSGINKGRGAIELVEAMELLDDRFFLIIAGSGDIVPDLKQMVVKKKLSGKVLFTGRLPYQEMLAYTKSAYIGIIPEKVEIGSASYLTLPNKLFDYIHAGIPVLSTNGFEVARIINSYRIGKIVEGSSPEHFALALTEIFENKEQLAVWKANTGIARETFCWENEEKVIVEMLNKL